MKRHWYQIEMSYMKNHRQIFAQTISVGLVCQSDILRHRQIKRQSAKQMIQRKELRPLLCNGEVKLTVLAYLGKFNGDAPNLRDYVAEKLGDLMAGYFIHIGRAL